MHQVHEVAAVRAAGLALELLRLAVQRLLQPLQVAGGVVRAADVGRVAADDLVAPARTSR